MVKARKPTRKPAPPPLERVQFVFKATPDLMESLDKWREKQVGPPSRPAAVRWILEQYLKQAEAADL